MMSEEDAAAVIALAGELLEEIDRKARAAVEVEFVGHRISRLEQAAFDAGVAVGSTVAIETLANRGLLR